MSFGSRWRQLLHFFRRDRATRELEEEMRFHLEQRATALQATQQLPPDVASAAARRQFGHPTQLAEAASDGWGMQWFADLLQDVRYAARRLGQRPGFTAAVVLVLALGIGATTAMFSAVDAAFLRPLPFRAPDRLAIATYAQIPFDPGQAAPRAGGERYLNITDLAAMPDLFSDVAAYSPGGLNLSDPQQPMRLRVGVVTPSFFHALGVTPAMGRPFLDAEGAPGGPLVVILSDALRRQRYGDANPLGQALRLGSNSYTIVGVMPRGFSFPEQSELWVPLTVPTTPASFEAFEGRISSRVLVRLAPGVTLARAHERVMLRWQQVSGAGQHTKRTNVDDIVASLRNGGTLQPLQQQLIGNRTSALLVLLGATGLLLLIACANVTNLLVAQAAMRHREIAVRTVLGATRRRVLRQLLVESVLLALTAVVAGLLLAPIALGLLNSLLPPTLTAVAPARLDLRVLGVAAALGLITGIAFGLWPARMASSVAASDTIQAGGGRTTAARRTGRGRRLLVLAEVALTVMLLIGAGLMLRSFSALMSVDRGLDVEHTGTLQLAFQRGTTDAQRAMRADAMLERLRATPGITAAGLVNDLPMGLRAGFSVAVTIDNPPPKFSFNDSFARYLLVSPGYFDALGIRLLRGRDFTAADGPDHAHVAVVSARMARQFWPGKDPIGQRLTLSGGDTAAITVVGMVADVRENNLEDDPQPQLYLSADAGMPTTLTLVARGTQEPAALLTALREAVRSVDPAQAAFNVKTMSSVLDAAVAPRRGNTILISVFAALALILAAVGVYAVVSNAMSQRRREFGIRTALGARGADLIRQVVGEMGPALGGGILLGLAGAWLLSRVAQSLLYGVTVHDTATFVAVPLLLGLLTAIATLLPARNVMRVNPADVIRAD